MTTLTHPENLPGDDHPASYKMADVTAAFPSQAMAAEWLAAHSSDPATVPQWEPAHRCWSATLVGTDAELYSLAFDGLSFVPLSAFDLGEG